MRSDLPSIRPAAPAGVAGAAPARPARSPGRCPFRPAPAASPRPARRPRARSRELGPRAALGVGGLRQRRLMDGRSLVLVVEVPPHIWLGLRVALGRVLPRL